MTDFFLLLILAGAGDELQGIKRGIMEMADIIAITKADGSNKLMADGAKITFQNALHLFPPQPSGWEPKVLACSSFQNTGIGEVWNNIKQYVTFAQRTGYFEERRKQQAVIIMHETIIEYLNHSFYNNEKVKLIMPELERQLFEGSITSYKAALNLLDKYFIK